MSHIRSAMGSAALAITLLLVAPTTATLADESASADPVQSGVDTADNHMPAEEESPAEESEEVSLLVDEATIAGESTEVDTGSTYIITGSAYSLQSEYGVNQKAMDEAQEWRFDRGGIVVGADDPAASDFVVPAGVKKITGYGTRSQGTILTPSTSGSSRLVFQAGSSTVLDNLYLAADRFSGSRVGVVVKAGAHLTVRNSILAGGIEVEDGADVTMEDVDL